MDTFISRKALKSSLKYTLEKGGLGFDGKIIRKIVSLRKMDESDRQEQEELLTVYMNAIGM